MSPITVYLADDNLIVREGVRALLELESDIEVVGVADDYDGLLSGAEGTTPQVVVTDIRMPPSFSTEGFDAAVEVRKRHPGTGIVAVKHAQASRAEIELTEKQDVLSFCVRDNGTGFDLTTTPQGDGLLNMTDRLEAMGGTLEVRSSHENGTSVTGHLPV